MKQFDTDKIPWLFNPHDEGELDEYFNSDLTQTVVETSRNIIESLSESRDGLLERLCYEFHYNQRRYKLTLLKFADMIVRADVTIKLLRSKIMELDIDNRELRKQLADTERKSRK